MEEQIYYLRFFFRPFSESVSKINFINLEKEILFVVLWGSNHLEREVAAKQQV